jgi:hypothetical protein
MRGSDRCNHSTSYKLIVAMHAIARYRTRLMGRKIASVYRFKFFGIASFSDGSSASISIMVP